MLADSTLNGTFAAKLSQVEEVNRGSWESILNYAEVLSLYFLNFAGILLVSL